MKFTYLSHNYFGENGFSKDQLQYPIGKYVIC